MSTTAPTTFGTYLKQGEELEDLIENLLRERGTDYTRNQPGHDGDLTEQHKGDFRLNHSGIYLEAKNDLLFAKYGNLYLEIGEIRSEDSPRDARTIQPIGVLKHSAKAPTVMIHQVGPDRFFVYSARTAVAAFFQGDREFVWNEKEDSKAGRLDKTNIGMIWKQVDRSVSRLMARTFFETNAEDLLQTVQRAAHYELKAEARDARALVELAAIYGRKTAWREKGWHRYRLQMMG